MNGSTGIANIYQYDGDPTGASTATIDPPLGALIINTLGGPPAFKTTAAGDNTGYQELTSSQTTTSTPVTGGSLTYNVLGNDENLYITPAGTLAALTLTFPTNALSRIGQIIGITSTQAIQALTVSSSGLTVNGPAVIALAANQMVSWRKTAASTWTRVGINDTASLATNSRIITENFTASGTDSVSVLGIGGAAFATTTALVHHMYSPAGYIYGIANIGVQTTAPVAVTTGLDIRGVETANIGIEVFSHFIGASGRPFIVGRDPAFFFRVSLTIADISGATVLLAGFRKAAINLVTYTSYTDYYAIGTIASAATGAINIAAEINSAGSAPTDTTNTWADAATKVFEIRVSAAGVITALINGVAPTVPSAQTFDDADAIIPFVHFIQHADIAGEVTINSYECGYI